MSFACGHFEMPPDVPDAGDGVCCAGNAMFGPRRCTCWVPAYDLEQAAPVPRDRQVRPAMCGDCAYRRGSPERRGDDQHAGDEEFLLDIVHSGEVFVCHQGIRRPVEWRHPSGATYPGSPADYQPPILDGVPFKADGTPADICAGWAARRLREVDRMNQVARSL